MDRRSLIKAALLSVIASGAGAFIPGPQARTQDPAARQPAAAATISPAKMSQVATVSDRFQSYNVEMAEVIGGNFWKPYSRRDTSAPSAPSATFEIGKDPSLFEARPPIDLRNRRLRILAAALGPAYVRVSGTWANSSWFQDDAPAATAPEGFTGVLTRNQWAGMMDFARAVDAKVVTSFAISKGVRDQAGLWTPVEAQKILAYTKAVNGEIVAAELFNEPNVASMGGGPPGYDAAAFARDVAAFRTFIDSHAPGIKLVGPGSVGEGTNATPIPSVSMIGSEDLLRAEPQPRFTVFSYHFYGAVSERCQARVPSMGTTADQALSEAWLARTETVFDFYKPLRDRYAPGAPIWITETADAACGGNRWGATFLDSFRYLDQLGRLARRGVDAIFHNTLAASEYGLLDHGDFSPRPNYWAALLWKRLMGTVVLDAGSSPAGLHLYAQCLPGQTGGVTLLAINISRTAHASLTLPVRAERYTLSSPTAEFSELQLNGTRLQLKANDGLPDLQPQTTPAGAIDLAPATITFLAMREAGNGHCR